MALNRLPLSRRNLRLSALMLFLLNNAHDLHLRKFIIARAANFLVVAAKRVR